MVRVSEPSTVCVAPPGLAVTVQLVGSWPPSSPGVHWTVAERSPATPQVLTGACGGSSGHAVRAVPSASVESCAVVPAKRLMSTPPRMPGTEPLEVYCHSDQAALPPTATGAVGE